MVEEHSADRSFSTNSSNSTPATASPIMEATGWKYGAHGEVILITDDDIQVEPDWIVRAGEALDQMGCDYVGGKVLPVWSRPTRGPLCSCTPRRSWQRR